MSKARDLSNFISDATVDATEIADLAVTHAKLHTDMNLSSKTLTFAANQISGNSVDGGVISNFASTGIDDNASSTAVTILSDGKVGIGITSPIRQLHLASSVPSIRLEDTDVSGAYNDIVHLSTGELSIRVDHGNVQSNSSLSFLIDADEKMRIDTSGNVGIGETSPNQPLVVKRATDGAVIVANTGQAGGQGIGFFTDTANNRVGVFNNSSSSLDMVFNTGGTATAGEAMRIDNSTKNVGIGTTSNLSNNLGTLLNVNNGNIIGNGTGGSYFTYNARYDNSWLRNETSGVGIISLTNSGKLTYRTAVSGNAGTEPSLTEIIRTGDADPAYITFDGASQVRLTLGNEGTPGTNTANWIRGNAGYLQYNSASSGHTWEIGGSEKMRIHSDGNVGIGITGPIGSLNVNGTSTIYNAHQDQDLTVTPGNGHSMAGSGEISMVATFQGTGANNDLFEFQYDATSWKSFGFEIDISTATGWGKVNGGGYNNGGAFGNYSITGTKITAFAFDNVAGNSQAHILRCTFGGGVHHTIRVKYWQGGGDGGPRADRATMRFIS